MTFRHPLDIFIGACSYLFSYFILPYIILILYQNKKIIPICLVIPFILISDCIFAISGSLIWDLFPQTKWAFVIACVSSVICCTILKYYSLNASIGIREKNYNNNQNTKNFLIVLISIVSLFSLHDTLIFLSQNWDDINYKFYATSPLLLDPVRNTNLVTAILRNSENLFTAEGRIAYQIFWHKGAALNASVLPLFSKTAWYQVMGFTVATTIIYEIVIVWAVYLLSNVNSNIIFLSIFSLLLARLDINLIYFSSFFEDKKFEYFSPTIMCLTAPQHTSSMIYFIVFITLGIYHNTFYPGLIRVFIGSGAVIFSPPLAAMGYPIYYTFNFIYSIFFRRKVIGYLIIEALCIIIVAGIFFTLTNDVSIFSHIFRKNLDKIFWLKYQFSMVSFCLLMINSIGILSILILFLFIVYFYYRHLICFRIDIHSNYRVVLNCFLVVVFSILTITFWNFIYTSVETRRHSSMFAVSMIIITLPILISYLESKKINLIFSLFIPLLIYSHFNLIQSYIKKQSDIVTFINWNDYRCIGEIIKGDKEAAIISASGMGVVLPILNEYATTLAPRMAIAVHEKLPASSVTNLNIDHLEYGALRRDELERTEFLNGLFSIGYNYIVWGLLEELEWGELIKHKALSHQNLVASCGQVNLYKFYGNIESPILNHDKVYDQQKYEARAVVELIKLGMVPFWKKNLIYAIVNFDQTNKLISASTISELTERVKSLKNHNNNIYQ